MCTDFYEKSRI
uniref:Uncharacterized protein n=1 Tax=Arundo donax TaxID=35708 RepID=A0A0A9HVX3_ARUDO